MPKSRPPYPAEFRARMAELVRAGRTPEALSREFEPTAQPIWNWVHQAERDQGARQDGLATDEREELRRLRRSMIGERARRSARSLSPGPLPHKI